MRQLTSFSLSFLLSPVGRITILVMTGWWRRMEAITSIQSLFQSWRQGPEALCLGLFPPVWEVRTWVCPGH